MLVGMHPMPPVDRSARAGARARELFLADGGVHGCAETAFVVLKEAFGLPDPTESGAAMALNGGIAYSGATSGQ